MNGVDGTSLITALLARETAWGQITDAAPGLSAEQLLAAISSAFAGLGCEAHRQLRLEAIVRNVAALPSGLCRYDEMTAALTVRDVPTPPEVLKRIYKADYHDIEHVPAILVLIGKLRDAVTRYGQRGVRIMNCEAGVFAQRAYVACAALSLGCGAVLGFDSAALSRTLGLDQALEVPLLLFFVGARRPRALAFDFRLCD
jgi:SagB-type dehydrogenase family enzyme